MDGIADVQTDRQTAGKCVWDGIARSSIVVTYTVWSVEWTFQWTQVGNWLK